MRLIAALALLLASPAFAGTLWWNRVTQFEDGRELGPGDPVTYHIEASDNGGAFVKLRTATAASISMDHPAGVLRCYRVYATVPDVDGTPVAGDPSNEWCSDLRPAPPPPTRRPQAVAGLGGN
jgi:hypothetical protein